MADDVTIESNCKDCGLRQRAEKNPKSLIARLWRWHTTWCPGWKAYKLELQEKGLEPPQVAV